MISVLTTLTYRATTDMSNHQTGNCHSLSMQQKEEIISEHVIVTILAYPFKQKMS